MELLPIICWAEQMNRKAAIKIGCLLFDGSQNRGYSPVRGNVCTADKRVPAFEEKAVNEVD
jgi:hypothetical protein